ILEVEPNHADANHNLGVLALQMEQAAAGLPHLKAALEANPNQGQYWLSYIDALIRTNQLDIARQLLTQGCERGLQGDAVDALAGRLRPGRAEKPAELESAIVHREAGRYSEAVQVLQDRLGRHPQDAYASALLAQVHSLNKQEAEAWIALRTALAIDPTMPMVQRNLARLLLKQQNVVDALQAAQAAYRSDATDPENQLVLAAALSANNEHEQAYQLVTTVLQHHPNYAEAFANRAMLRLRRKDIAGSLADVEQSLSIKPHLTQLWGMAGSLRYQLNNLPGAIDALEKALYYEPNNIEHLLNLGEIKRQSGSLEVAIAVLEKATALAPENANVWALLGTVLQGSERSSEAQAAYAKALTLAPEHAEVANNLGALAKAEGNWEDALRYFKRALAIKPNFVEAHNNLGVALQNMRRFDEAVASFRAALALMPEYAAAHNNLGATFKDMGRLEEAEASYRQALKIQPDHAEAICNLANTLCDLDKLPQAALEYQKALTIDPANSGLDAAVHLAILCYLDGDIVQSAAKLLESRPIRSTTNSQHKHARVYWHYLDKLVSHRQQLGDQDQHPEYLETLHVIGESHSLSTHGIAVRYKGKKMRCAAEWISGCKQWHLGNDKANRYKHRLELIMARLAPKSTILLCIGEIDCRHDEGIIKASSECPGKTLVELAHATVDAYIHYVAAIAERFGHRIVVGGVPCPNIPFDELAEATAKQFVHLIQIFNQRLKSQALAARMDFLNMHALTDRGDGISNGEWHIDHHHLLPHAVAEAFDRHGQVERSVD
ncbi:MAG TPA: tetratricopeptide repeat protein, partial [Telluria sp.]|nr:tetratricopeptide repeat protein [Telluria sp.]